MSPKRRSHSFWVALPRRALDGYIHLDRQHFIATPIAKLIVHKVDRPNMVGMCGPQPDDGAVFVIKPFALLVPARQL